MTNIGKFAVAFPIAVFAIWEFASHHNDHADQSLASVGTDQSVLTDQAVASFESSTPNPFAVSASPQGDDDPFIDSLALDTDSADFVVVTSGNDQNADFMGEGFTSDVNEFLPVADVSIEGSNNSLVVASTGQHLTDSQSQMITSLSPDYSSQLSTNFDNEERDDSQISGRLLTNNGRYVSGHAVTLTAKTLVSNAPTVKNYSIQTNRFGRFSFRNLPQGQYKLAVTKGNGFGASSRLISTGTSSIDLIVNEFQSVQLTGLITDSFDYPLSGVKAVINPGGVTVFSDESGHITAEIEVEQERYFEVNFQTAGYIKDRQVITPDVLQSSIGNVLFFHKQLTLEQQYSELAGTITGKDGMPVSGAKVVLKSRAGRMLAFGATNVYGEYAFKNIVPGQRTRIHVAPRGSYASTVTELGELDVGLNLIDLKLERLAANSALEGVVVDSEGNPVSGFPLEVYSKTAGRTMPTITDQAGRFRFDSLPAGMVSIRSNSVPRVSLNNIAVSPEEITTITLPVDKGGQDLVGKIVDRAGSPVSGAKVELISSMPLESGAESAHSSFRARSDSNGSFTISNLGAGSRYLKVSAKGFETNEATVQVPVSTGVLRINLNSRS